MTIHFTGGCACGTIRYEWSAEPVFAGIAIAVIANGQLEVRLPPWSSCHVVRAQPPAM